MQEHGLTAAEWRVMEVLWDFGTMTGREVTERMAEKCGWSRSTTLTLLSRMESKGMVGSSDAGKKQFFPLISRDSAALQETESFLERVYKGSVSLMLSALTKKQSLSQQEIDELHAILDDLETKTDG